MTADTPPPTLREQKSRNRQKILSESKGLLSEKELARLERKQRSLQNRRGRKNPSTVPDRLTRTSAFAPRRQGLITDSNFYRVYEVPGYSVVEVHGRELGSQHRDAIYALFRLKLSKIHIPNEKYRTGSLLPMFITHYKTSTSWRDILKVMGRTQHVNNLLSLLQIFSEIRQVSFIVHQGKTLKEVDGRQKANRLVDGKGNLTSIIKEIEWDGAQLDSAVTVTYGETVLEMIEKANLVSLNAEVQFRLKSDYAKTFWPFIDSQPSYHYVDEDLLAKLTSRDLWAEGETSATRAQFRKDCRQAFSDMEKAGGLKTWREEVTGTGRTKSRRYHYKHAMVRQMELELLPLEAAE